MDSLNCMPFTFLDSFKRIFCGLFSCSRGFNLNELRSYFAIVAILRLTNTLDFNLYRFAFSFYFGCGMNDGESRINNVGDDICGEIKREQENMRIR